MPYITKERREAIAEYGHIDSAGELNYAITRLLAAYTAPSKALNYQRINDVLGALEGAKLEFYSRVAAPYEKYKLALNGDVYT
jgi:hypothetical protein